MMTLFPLLLLLFAWFFRFISSLELFDLPVVSEKLQQAIQPQINRKFDNGKFIPPLAWIAIRSSNHSKLMHSYGFMNRNPDWKVNFCDNDEKDKFIDEYFAGTSFHWAYNIINPVIGTAKSELWRIAILYVHGGMYMDDDADVLEPLSNIVLPTDKFIIAKESYNWTDMCYRDEYLLSNASFNKRYGDRNLVELFDNRFFLNWIIFSSPGNPLLLRIMQHIVNLIRYEHLSLTMIKLAPTDHRGKLLMCMSTFPITLAARELVIEGKQGEIGLRVASEQFSDYKGNMKAYNNDHNPNRWVKQMNKMKLPYLKEYLPPNISLMNGRLLQFSNSREIFLYNNTKLHSFPDFQTFLDMKFSLDIVQMIPHRYFNEFTVGDPLPSTIK